MDIIGSIIKKMPVQTGEGSKGPWQKQEFVIQTDEQFPKTVCFSTWGQRVDDLGNFNENDKVKVFFDINSREYNNRWYTDLRMWRIESADGSSQTSGQAYNTSNNPISASVTQPNAPAASAPEPEDDLPF